MAHNFLKKQEEKLAEAENQLDHDKKVLELVENTTPFSERDNKVSFIKPPKCN